MGGSAPVVTFFTAGSYLQEGWLAGVSGDTGTLQPYHNRDSKSAVCVMVETVLAGDMVAVDHQTGFGFIADPSGEHPAASTGRNATDQELADIAAAEAARKE